MSTQSQFENANAAAAFVASLNAIRYLNSYEHILDAKGGNNGISATTATGASPLRNSSIASPTNTPTAPVGNENLFMFPSSQSLAALAAASSFVNSVNNNTAAVAAAMSPFHQHLNQQFQQHFTQQFQNQISQMRFDAATAAAVNVNNKRSPHTHPSDTPTSTSQLTTNNTSPVNNVAYTVAMDLSDLPKDDSKCHACGDKSTGSHFGGISCESCKAFFRRSVQRNRWEEYKCSYNGECKMNTNTRKICQYCRYKRCLSIGMRPKWVLSDDERQQKYGSRRKKNKIAALEAAAAMKTSSENSDPDAGVPINELEDRFYKYGTDDVDIQNRSFTRFDQIVIDKLSYAFYHSRKANQLDLSATKDELKRIKDISLPSDDVSKKTKVLLANFMVQPVRRVISFAKCMPDFRNLMVEDQMALLRGSTMEIFICSSQNLFDQATNSFQSFISKERNISHSDGNNNNTEQGNTLELSILKYIWSDEVYERTLSYLKYMQDLDIDETTLALYVPLILFSPDRLDLVNRDRVLELQNKYSVLLYKYLSYKYGKVTDIVDTLYAKLLLKLIDLRDLRELHSSILLDVADSSEVELYSQSIMKDSKNDNDKMKSFIQQQQQDQQGGSDESMKMEFCGSDCEDSPMTSTISCSSGATTANSPSGTSSFV